MASTGSYVYMAYEQTPRFENAPAASPYLVSTAGRFFPITTFRITPAPQIQNREDELRGIEGAAAQMINSYLPTGEIAMRQYPDDMIFLLGLAGFQATVTAGAATLDTWTVAQGGTWTGGTFTLTVTGTVTATTGPIPWNATPQQVSVALQSAITQQNAVLTDCVLVSGAALPAGTLTVRFTGPLSGLSQTLTGNVTGLTGTAPTLTLTHSATGANGGSAALPDGGYPPTGTNVWSFAKRAGLNARSAQFQLVYFNEQVFLQGQGYGLTALGGDAAGSITGSLSGLVFSQIADPSLTPTYVSTHVPWFRRGDIQLVWLTGTGTANDFTWSVANPLEQLDTLGVASFFPDKLLQGPGRTLVTGTIPKRSLATADLNALLGAGSFAATTTWRTTRTIGGDDFGLLPGAAAAAGTAPQYPYSMFLQMPSCQYTGGDPDPLTNARRFGGSFNWFAAYDEVAGYDARWTVVSSLASTAVASAGVGL